LLFSIAIRSWSEQRINKQTKAQKRTGVAITLNELYHIPVTDFRELWTDLAVREGSKNAVGKVITKNIKIEIRAQGFKLNENWEVGFEFDYGRDNLIYVRLAQKEDGSYYDFPEVLNNETIGYLPSISGLKATEDKLELGSILRLMGSGNTADVLRNICYLVYQKNDKSYWNQLVKEIEDIFRITLNPPIYFPRTGLIKMSYNEGSKKEIDLLALGSGCRQAILLLAYLHAFDNTVILLDEPDAHLEFIRQSNIYDKISDLAKKKNNQIIIACHSESVLRRAFGKDKVISAIFGKFDLVNHPSYISSALQKYGYEEFIIARQRPYIFYFEGTTDWDFIKAFAQKLSYTELLTFFEENVYPYPVANDIQCTKNHFATLKKFIPELKGFALFDNLNRPIENQQTGLYIYQWSRREIENYIPLPETLYHYQSSDSTLGGALWSSRFKEIVEERIPAAAIRNNEDRFWFTSKISDDLLTPVFEKFLDELNVPRGLMDKSKFYQLVEYIPDTTLISPEMQNVLEQIASHFGV